MIRIHMHWDTHYVSLGVCFSCVYKSLNIAHSDLRNIIHTAICFDLKLYTNVYITVYRHVIE